MVCRKREFRDDVLGTIISRCRISECTDTWVLHRDSRVMAIRGGRGVKRRKCPSITVPGDVVEIVSE